MDDKDIKALLGILKKNINKLPVKDVVLILEILAKYIDKKDLESKIKAV